MLEVPPNTFHFASNPPPGPDELGSPSPDFSSPPPTYDPDVDPTQDSIQSCGAQLVASPPDNSYDGSLLPPADDDIGSAARMANEMAAAGRQYGRSKRGRQARRLVQKTGDCNVVSRNVMQRKRSYLVDIFTTLVDMRWRLHVVLYTSAFIVSWCFFAIVWLVVAKAHGDLDEGSTNETWQVCVDNIFDYRTALLFSIETQHTIGYGTRAITEECWYAIIVLMTQSCLGTFVQALITGVIFAKISRPKGRSQTIMFSERAVICQRDDEYYLLFRVGDMRKSHIIGTSIRALMVKNRLTREGESIPLCQYPLALETEASRVDCFVFLVWPVTVVHRIDASSPLWDVSSAQLYRDHFEIIVMLEGTIESTGMLTQVRTSYVPAEVGWGEHLVPLLTYQLENGHYEIDYGQFHKTTHQTPSMPPCSARQAFNAREGGQSHPKSSPEKDYLVSFTAPAVRLVPKRSAVFGLFNRRHGVASNPHSFNSPDSELTKAKGGSKDRQRNYSLSQGSAGDTMRSSATVADPMQPGGSAEHSSGRRNSVQAKLRYATARSSRRPSNIGSVSVIRGHFAGRRRPSTTSELDAKMPDVEGNNSPHSTEKSKIEPCGINQSDRVAEMDGGLGSQAKRKQNGSTIEPANDALTMPNGSGLPVISEKPGTAGEKKPTGQSSRFVVTMATSPASLEIDSLKEKGSPWRKISEEGKNFGKLGVGGGDENENNRSVAFRLDDYLSESSVL